PEAGYKALWNLDYAYYTGGNSHNLTLLNWVSRSGVDRASVQDVFFLYYDGQPKPYSPPKNPQNLLFQFLAVSVTPNDLQGTAALGYRFKDPTKRDLSWAYVPALRRVRAISPANRSDGFLGPDQSQDDGFFFYGKLELWIDDQTWQGAWNRKFSWRGELLNVYEVTGYATAPFNEHERWWGATFALQLSENIKADRATASGMNGPGADPPNDRRI